MSIGVNILRSGENKTVCDKYILQGRPIYEGRAPFGGMGSRDTLKVRPWLIAHPDCEGRLYKALRVGSFATFGWHAGASIALMVREWDESIDGPLPVIE